MILNIKMKLNYKSTQFLKSCVKKLKLQNRIDNKIYPYSYLWKVILGEKSMLSKGKNIKFTALHSRITNTLTIIAIV